MTLPIIKRCGDCGSIRMCGPIAVCPGCGIACVHGQFHCLQPGDAKILLRLALKPGERVLERELEFWLWGDRSDGGPAGTRNVIKQRVHWLRQALGRYAIVNTYDGGYILNVPALDRRAA